ncbi:MAG: type II toxin-antitoxin system VapC family toxin [Rubrivivax sp.]|jgi:toxin-antitoxin system PIN domain toxin
MIAIDTNVLVYAHRSEAPFHEQAFGCVKALAEGGRRWGIPVACLHEFLAVVTHPKVFRPASRFDQALAQVDAWLAAPHVQVLHSGPEHWRILGDLARSAKLQGGQFHDARIAAICIENAVEVLWTADRDFGRFKALTTVNPLV